MSDYAPCVCGHRIEAHEPDCDQCDCLIYREDDYAHANR